MTALSLRQVSAQHARLRQRIGAGCSWPFTLAGQSGVMRLTLANEPCPEGMSHWVCDAGSLQFSDAEAVCSLMSTCPLFALEPEAPEQAWYWPWWQQQLSAELLALFGHLSLTQSVAEPADMLLTLTLVRGEQQAESLLALSTASLEHLINKTGWQQDAQPLPDSMMLSLPITVGELVLSPAGLQSLRCGDVLLPETLHFTPEGRGTIRSAGWQLQGELQLQPGTMAHFYLTEMERSNVTLTHDEYEQENLNPADPSRDAEPTGGATDFAPLPLALSVRCGQLKLTLGELTRLSPGAMVMIDNVKPGEALLCHGDYPLARGELVDVEGRLGLQITHLLPASKDPLCGSV